MEKSRNIIGIDIGGTNFRIGTVSTNGDMRHVEIIPSSFVGEADAPLKAISGFIENYIQDNGVQDVECVSMGIPGTLDRQRKVAYSVPNITNEKGEHILDGLNIVDGVESGIGIPVLMDRDVNNLMAYDMFMEKLFGRDIVIGCYIGTGFGGAIHIFGQYLLGKNGVANEIGHIPFYKGNLTCACGKKACTECYASGRALRLIAEEHFPGTFIGDIFVKHGDAPVVREFVEACALPIATQATIFDPDCIVIGGGVVDMPGFPKERLMELVRENTRQPLPAQGLEMVYSGQSKDMGVIGAAIYAMKQRNVAFGESFEENIRAYIKDEKGES